MPLAKNDAHGENRNGWAFVESAPLFAGVSLEDSRRISAAARCCFWRATRLNRF